MKERVLSGQTFVSVDVSDDCVCGCGWTSVTGSLRIPNQKGTGRREVDGCGVGLPTSTGYEVEVSRDTRRPPSGGTEYGTSYTRLLSEAGVDRH